MSIKRGVIGLIVVLLLGSCDALSAVTSPPTPTPEPRPEVVALEAAKRHLETHLGRQLEGVDVAYGPMDWEDSSLGCPQEGVSYAAVVTPGFLFEITVDGVLYELHANADGSQVVLCHQPPAAPIDVTGPKTSSEAVDAARILLADHLGVAIEELAHDPAAAEVVLWSDTSLGCPQDGEAYQEVEVLGFQLQFLHEGETYDLRVSQDGGLVVLCSSIDAPPAEVTVPTYPEEVAAPLEAARALLADALNRSLKSVVFEAATWEEATFPSSALGCPEPDMVYLDVLTDGYVLELGLDGLRYEVHTDLEGEVAVLCTEGLQPAEPVGEAPPLVFTSYSDPDLGFGISHPLDWSVQLGATGDERVMTPSGGEAYPGMAVAQLGSEGDVELWLSTYRTELYASDATALQSGSETLASDGSMTLFFLREVEGVVVMERVIFLPAGYRLRQWTLEEDWPLWIDPFDQMLNSLVTNLGEGG